MTRRPTLWAFLTIVTATATLLAAPWLPDRDLKVTPVVSDGKVFASIAAPGAFGDDAREMARSGLLVTYSYFIELRRPSTFWLDHTVAESTAAATVKFDSLSSVFQVSKLRDGKVVWSERTDKDSDVQAWMTSFDQVPLDPTEALEANADYYVRVRLRMSPHRTFSMFPWGHDDGTGRAEFTFIR
jgi:hypothetical protein